MTHPPTENPSFGEYEALLRRLHELTAAGGDDTPEAETIRDRMEAPGSQLGRDEIALLKGLSADLYMLQGDEISQPIEEGERPVDRLRAELQEVWDREDWPRGLALLRKRSSFLTEDQVAYLRYDAYSRLGLRESAALFIKHAATLNPQELAYGCLLTDSLIQLGRQEEALRQAETWLDDPQAPVTLRIQAAGVLALCADASPDAQPSLYHRAAEVLSAALQEDQSPADLPGLRAYGYTVLGLCHEALGQPGDARAAYDAALTLDPDNEGALVARGLLRLEDDRAGALDDFERALGAGATHPAAYAVVAENCLRTGDFSRCVALCRHLLKLSPRPHLAATVFQWLAVATFRLGGPVERSQAWIQTAIDLDPFNEALEASRREFEQIASGKGPVSGAAVSWQQVPRLDSADRREDLRPALVLAGFSPAA